MKTYKKNEFQYYLFSLSNLLAAIGGGTILGKGINVINVSFLHASSLLAFFVGTSFGLLFLQIIPKKFSSIIARSFSFLGGISSLILILIFENFSVNQKLIGISCVLFFILLSLRFGFWFYSRVQRAAEAAGQEQRIAWVEFGYYIGIVAGLILWVFLGISIGIKVALLIDALLQLFAGVLDVLANYFNNKITQQRVLIEEVKKINFEKKWGWRLAISVMFLTVAVQVIIFKIAHLVNEQLSSYVLAAFYSGAAVSAFFCKHWNVYLEWSDQHTSMFGYASIFLKKGKIRVTSFLFGSFLLLLILMTIILSTFNGTFDLTNHHLMRSYFFLFLIFVSTFIYGVLELAILDRIGFEEKCSIHRNMVMHTYGLMSLGAVIGLWILSLSVNMEMNLMVTLFFSLVLTICPIRKRYVKD